MSNISSWFGGLSTEEILRLSKIDEIGPINWNRIYNHFENYRQFLNAKNNELIGLGLRDKQVESLKKEIDTDKISEGLKKYDIKLVLIDDKKYPKLLKEINDPPLWLYYKGDLEIQNNKCLTVVGSRKPSQSALSALDKVITKAIAEEITIVSGLAFGIDKAVHLKSLESKGKTVAVLAGGLDSIYPTMHTKIADKIVENGGLLLSEYPPLSRPLPFRFPIRNRIVAGLSPVTLIIEAKLPSGSLTTAKAALDNNREVWAIPADINNPNAQGGNYLINQGASCIFRPEQIAEFYDIKLERKDNVEVDKQGQKILDLLGDGPKSFEELVEKLELPVDEALSSLTSLELDNLIYQSSINNYERK